MPHPKTYTAKQLSEILQVPLTEVYRGGADGSIPGRIKVGRRTRFNARVIDRFLNGQSEE